MSDKVKAASILGLALIISAILIGGIYQIVPVGTDPARAYRLNRFTGSTTLIFNNREIPMSALSALPIPTATPQ